MSIAWKDTDGLMFWEKTTGSQFGEEKQSRMFRGCYFLIQTCKHRQPCCNRGTAGSYHTVLHPEFLISQQPVLILDLRVLCHAHVGWSERAVVGPGALVCLNSTRQWLGTARCVRGRGLSSCSAGSAVWIGLLSGQEFPAHKLIYGCGVETRNKIPVKRWMGILSCESEKDTECLSDSSSQFHEQGCQQHNFLPCTSRVLVTLPSVFCNFGLIG